MQKIMKDSERIRLLYQNDCAFNMGIIVGKKEMIEKACEWMELRLVATMGSEDAHEFLTKFIKAMGE